jgi:hypothetical protein
VKDDWSLVLICWTLSFSDIGNLDCLITREPGGEHLKQLIVKNVLMKTQKIRYKLPKTRYFSMEFPKTVTLSAGMSWMIPITFRPLAKVSF